MSDAPDLHVLAVAGSLRKESLNRALVRAAIRVAPPGMVIEDFALEEIPPFNQEMEERPPERVRLFKQEVAAADALLMATPEYNFSFSGVLKNAIDWGSRPYGNNSFEDKPVAVMSAGGATGGLRAQLHLRQVFVYLNMHPINKPSVTVVNAKTKLDGAGEFTDPAVTDGIRQLLVSLDSWTRRLGKR